MNALQRDSWSPWGLLLFPIFLGAVFGLFASLLFIAVFGKAGDPGKRATEAAVLTLRAEQTEIERSGEYLGSKSELGASEPELGPYFIDGGLDQSLVEEDGRTMVAEFTSDGGTIRLAFLDGNLVDVTCREMDSCPSAAELYEKTELPDYS